jgi:exodeoxyribonuclease-3
MNFSRAASLTHDPGWPSGAGSAAPVMRLIPSFFSACARATERAALAELQGLGLRDVVRDRWPNERVFTYWDYRAGMFHQDLGMRIDLVLAGPPVAGRVRAAWVDRQARKGSGPSDHAPVIVDLDEAPDGDIGPVVPPPSRPVVKRGSRKLPQSS